MFIIIVLEKKIKHLLIPRMTETIKNEHIYHEIIFMNFSTVNQKYIA
jgi:hypothetical protein